MCSDTAHHWLKGIWDFFLICIPSQIPKQVIPRDLPIAKKLLCTKPLGNSSPITFHPMKFQLPEEGITAYITDLHQFSENNDFGTGLEFLSRDCLVCSFWDEPLLCRLLLRHKLTLPWLKKPLHMNLPLFIQGTSERHQKNWHQPKHIECIQERNLQGSHHPCTMIWFLLPKQVAIAVQEITEMLIAVLVMLTDTIAIQGSHWTWVSSENQDIREEGNQGEWAFNYC